MILLPAIDLVDGKATRLTEGKAGTEKTYGDPATVAQEFAAAGARWLHLVDLDAAFSRGSNAALVEEIVGANSELRVEVSGGLRDDAALQRVLQAGGGARESRHGGHRKLRLVRAGYRALRLAHRRGSRRERRTRLRARLGHFRSETYRPARTPR